jgi:DNA-binding transcriptional LysR family regulator
VAAGIVKVKGKAAGSVLVRNPKFSLAFTHPRTVRTGEPYEASATVLNTSSSFANQVRISLGSSSLSGGVLESDDMEVARAAVIAGLGIGVLPIYMVGDALRQGQLVPLLRQFRPEPESAIYLVYLPNRSLPSRVRALIDFLVAQFGPVPSWETGW